MKLRLFVLAGTAAALLGGCASTASQFNPIESRTVPKIIRLKMNANLQETGADATRSSAINLEMFRAKVMNTTPIRFVEANEDAEIDVSFGPVALKAMLGFLDKHVEQRFTMRITEGSGRVIYIVTGELVGRYEGEIASELNRVFVDVVIPVLQGEAPKQTSEAGSIRIQRM